MFLFVFLCILEKSSMQLFPIPLMNFQYEEASLKSTLKKKERKKGIFVCLFVRLFF